MTLHRISIPLKYYHEPVQQASRIWPYFSYWIVLAEQGWSDCFHSLAQPFCTVPAQHPSFRPGANANCPSCKLLLKAASSSYQKTELQEGVRGTSVNIWETL